MSMLQLLDAVPPSAACRLAARMPDAPLYRLRAQRLEASQSPAAPLDCSPALCHAMATAAAGQTLLAGDAQGRWRLRRADHEAPLWWAQTLADSRRHFANELRQALATRLFAQLLHELRNPMNALSLHSDLLARLLSTGAPAERSEASLRVIRERLNDLNARQNATANLWLGSFDGGEQRQATLASVVDEVLRLMRGTYSLAEVRLRSEALDACGGRMVGDHHPRLRLALIALLLLACDAAQDAAAAAGDVLLQGSGDSLVFDAGFSAAAPAPGFATGFAIGSQPLRFDAVLAQLALLLEDDGVSLDYDGARRVTLRFG